jgi:hypothetical protein
MSPPQRTRPRRIVGGAGCASEVGRAGGVRSPRPHCELHDVAHSRPDPAVPRLVDQQPEALRAADDVVPRSVSTFALRSDTHSARPECVLIEPPTKRSKKPRAGARGGGGEQDSQVDCFPVRGEARYLACVLSRRPTGRASRHGSIRMKLPQLAFLVGGAALAIVARQKAGDAQVSASSATMTLHVVPGEMSTATFRGVEIRFAPEVALVSKSATTRTGGRTTSEQTLTVDGKELVVDGGELRIGDERYGQLSPKSVVVIGKAGVTIDEKEVEAK